MQIVTSDVFFLFLQLSCELCFVFLNRISKLIDMKLHPIYKRLRQLLVLLTFQYRSVFDLVFRLCTDLL